MNREYEVALSRCVLFGSAPFLSLEIPTFRRRHSAGCRGPPYTPIEFAAVEFCRLVGSTRALLQHSLVSVSLGFALGRARAVAMYVGVIGIVVDKGLRWRDPSGWPLFSRRVNPAMGRSDACCCCFFSVCLGGCVLSVGTIIVSRRPQRSSVAGSEIPVGVSECRIFDARLPT